MRAKVKGVDAPPQHRRGPQRRTRHGIACWFVDTDYNEEELFCSGLNGLLPRRERSLFRALKTTLRAEIDQEAWETLHKDTSRAFPKPKSGRIAVKVINHLGDEVMKVSSRPRAPNGFSS